MQRKVFRVEHLLGGRTAARPTGGPERPANAARTQSEPADTTEQRLELELVSLHDTIAGHKRELTALIGDHGEQHITRAAGELGAAVEGMEKATVKILKSTEIIDESARALSAVLKTDFERGLAQDIQEHVVKIYEACNFQDVGGQRIGHAIATLNMIEDRVAGMLDRCKVMPGNTHVAKQAAAQKLINGPRLDGASGHTSQHDIDALFG